MKIIVVGTGFVGLPHAAVLAENGHEVHAYDIDAERIAANLHAAVEVPITAEGRQIAVTLSIGVAIVRPGESPDVAMRQADAALYRAKREGRARTVVYDPRIDGA